MDYIRVDVMPHVSEKMWQAVGQKHRERLASSGHSLTYIDPIGLSEGDVVIVPYGERTRIGVVSGAEDRAPKGVRMKQVMSRL